MKYRYWEFPDLVLGKLGIYLRLTEDTGELVIVRDSHLPYYNVLAGPFHDVEDTAEDLRIFVNYRELEGSVYLTLMVQDADDDVFLNGGVVPKYDVGVQSF